MPRSLIYARVSYDDRDNDGRNLAGQLAMGREYCTKRGYQTVAELAEDDKGASGAEINLPQLSKAREMARAGLYDVLVVRELDRLSRNLAKQLTVEEELKRRGVTIEYVLYDYPDTPEGRLMKNIRASFAEFEREKIRERMMRGKRHKVAAGNILVSTGAPYGYRLHQDDRRITLGPHLGEAAAVRQIFLWYAQDVLPIREIVRQLNEIGAPAPESGGRKRAAGWPRSTVFRILHSSTYIGEWNYTCDGTERLTVSVPPLVEQALWNAAQAILDQNRERMSRAAKYEYLFGRRLTCGQCGRFMACEPQRRGDKLYLYYVCAGERHDRAHGCKGMRVRVDAIDGISWEWLTTILKDPDKLQSEIDVFQTQAMREHAPTIEQLHITDELLAENRTKLARLADLYISGVFPLEDLQERKTRLEQSIKTLENQKAELTALLEGAILTPKQINDIRAIAADLRERLEGATYEQKVQLFQILDVGGILNIEDRDKTIRVRCSIRPIPDSFTVDATATRRSGRGTHISHRFPGWSTTT